MPQLFSSTKKINEGEKCPDGSKLLVKDISENKKEVSLTCFYGTGFYVEHDWKNGQKVTETPLFEHKVTGFARYKVNDEIFGVIEVCENSVKRLTLFNKNVRPLFSFMSVKNYLEPEYWQNMVDEADIVYNFELKNYQKGSSLVADFKACDYSDLPLPSKIKKVWLNGLN